MHLLLPDPLPSLIALLYPACIDSKVPCTLHSVWSYNWVGHGRTPECKTSYFCHHAWQKCGRSTITGSLSNHMVTFVVSSSRAFWVLPKGERWIQHGGQGNGITTTCNALIQYNLTKYRWWGVGRFWLMNARSWQM